MKLPEVPGEEPEEPEGPTPQVALSYGEEEELPEYNFVELINDSDTATSTGGLTVEILNPDGGVITFAVHGILSFSAGRTDEWRDGQAGVRTCRFRWGTDQ